MAILLFTNGLIDYVKPKNLVFSEQELIDTFSEYEVLKTYRLINVVNTWCVYGENVNTDVTNHNRIASDIVNADVFSPMLFVHDSEINPDWKMTDNILYKSYNEFLIDVKRYINEMAEKIINEFKTFDENGENYIVFPQLTTVGSTPDKKILFMFNPNDQSKEFYDNDEFYIFSQRVYDYLKNNKQEKEPFTIYADKKAIIIVETPNVKIFLDSLLEKFKSKEEYEICLNINNIFKSWNKSIKKRPKRNNAKEKS